ncbi:methylglyoxal synthase [Tissierella sp. MB52-C2]|nr:methylglyoxal synthase [Tissierella sp. MB52-C2]WMM26453.1 methylglyoxal synthase [Tissierella sp. MB52-C2]
MRVQMNKRKNIALIAHDNRKEDLINWVKENKDKLSNHFLCGTGTTAKRISERTGLDVKGFKSGPLGGDQQIGSRIVEGDIDMMIFFWDPLEAQPHDPDVKALLRIAVLYDIPVANNKSSADYIISSPIMNEEYTRGIIDFNKSKK